MLYLITGQPGSGKTLYMVSQLLKNPDLKDREIYVDGITDLDHEKISYKDVPEGHSVDDWYDWLPHGAVLVVDECQRFFRPRPNGSAVPKKVTELETHRHQGHDLFFITQHPRLIDINVRSFVENHKHFGKTQLGNRRMFEWQRCGNPDSRSDTGSAMVSLYALDKQAMNLYKSAEVHTKIKVGRSKWVYAFPVFVILLIICLWFAYANFRNFGRKELAEATNGQNGSQTEGQTATQNAAQQVNGISDQVAQNSGLASGSASQSDSNLKESDWQPSIEGQPWTAPIYNGHNRSIQTMPYPVGCVQNGNRCTCYTEQSTPIREMSDSLCRRYVQDGIYNPYVRQREMVGGSNVGGGGGGSSVSVLDGRSKENLAYGSDVGNMAQ